MENLPAILFVLIIIGIFFLGVKADKYPIGSPERRNYVILMIIMFVAMIVPFIMITKT